MDALVGGEAGQEKTYFFFFVAFFAVVFFAFFAVVFFAFLAMSPPSIHEAKSINVQTLESASTVETVTSNLPD
ncbi:hypothetical protein [Bradyrhizobium sp. SHOUNA76]|uniref:hypothetical protein n=1 Tax=Bradyrhizobium sp. SHOUNA76 TaxID=2908927 RepID=UPI001FF10BA8|nr:hypothetical protein [Bradyrhizobium sp. SHOUNA76]MCJ9700839.1 hypothetical protein [Bradyrhizobium sp. SHOUNA76]